MADDAGVATVKGEIPVRGVCRNGHTTTATSAKGRVTWEGPCSHEGCTLTVKGRRVPKAGADKPAPAPAPPSEAAAPAGRFEPIEVVHAKPARQQRAPEPAADNRPDAERADDERTDDAGSGDQSAVGVVERGEHHSREQARRGSGRFKRRRPRLTREQRAEARAAIERDWIVPGVIPR